MLYKLLINVWVIFSLSLLSCGTHDFPQSHLLLDFPTDLVLQTDGSQSTIDPPYVNDDYKVPLTKITITFGFKLSSTTTPFVYNNTHWGLIFGDNIPTKVYSTQDTTVNFSVTDTVTPSAIPVSLAQGTVTITIAFTGNMIPKDLWDTNIALNGKRVFKVTPFYDPTDLNNQTLRLGAFTSSVDTGALRDPVRIVSMQTYDNSATWSITPPDTATAEDFTSGTNVEKTSHVQGYLVVYWQEDECVKAGSWKFKPHTGLIKTGSSQSADPQDCNYAPSRDSNPCQLGCSTTAVADWNNKSLEDIAIPLDNSSGTDHSGVQGCYHTLKVGADQSSLGVGNLVNGKKYGAFLLPLDGSQQPGTGRTACMWFTPKETVLSSTTLNPDLPRTQDCFVATAASGDPLSETVHIWRVLRDGFLPKMFTKWYYGQPSSPGAGKKAAQWLHGHSQWKPLINTVLNGSGKILFHGRNFVYSLWNKLETMVTHLKTLWSQTPLFFAQKAQGAPQTSITTAHHPAGSGMINFQLGAVLPEGNQEIWDAFYPKAIPIRLALSQDFKLFSLGGAWELGYRLQYTFSQGKSSNGDKKVPIAFYSMGLMAEVQYLFLNLSRTWLQPSVFAYGGTERFRESISDPALMGVPVKGVTVWHPAYGGGIQLGFSMTKWIGATDVSLRSSGLYDCSFQLMAAYQMETGKGLTVGGPWASLGISGLLL